MALSAEETKEIAEKYYTNIYRYAFAKTRDKQTALDLTQDTFLLLCKKAPELENENILGWLYCVCANKVKEYFRRYSNEKNFISIDDIPDIAVTDDYSEIDSVSDEMFSLMQKRLLALLSPEEQREFIALFINKQDIRVFADENGISENAANIKKSRMKQKLKKLYRDTYFILLFVSVKFF